MEKSAFFRPAGTVAMGLLLAFGAAGCGSKQKTASGSLAGAGSTVDWGMGALDRSRCDEKGKNVITADTDRDDKPDVWKLYVTKKQGGSDVQVLTCKQVDLNHDGKVDLVDHYGDDGTIVMTEMDLDFDGKFDRTNHYSGEKLVRQETDMGFDNRPDLIGYFENGKLVRVERDSNGDGTVDEWHFYEGGKLDRIGYDTNQSGKPDKWDRAAEGETQETAQEDGAPAADPKSDEGDEATPAAEPSLTP